MYYYIKDNRTLGEQVTISQPRSGSVGFNKIYVFWNKASIWNTANPVTIKFYYGNNSTSEMTMTIVNETLPEVNADLKYFEENKTYRFATIDIPSTVLAYEGYVTFVVRVFQSVALVATLTDMTFMVNGRYAYDDGISESQYNYLISNIQPSPVINKLNRDGSNTITGNINPDTNNSIDFGSEETQFNKIYSKEFIENGTSLVNKYPSEDITDGEINNLFA